MISITVKHRETGDPIAGQYLSLELGGGLMGWTKAVETDHDGKACFMVAPNEGTLFVNGNRFFQGLWRDGAVIFLDDLVTS